MEKIEYIVCGRIHKENNWLEEMHKHTYHQFIVIESGTLEITTAEGSKIKAKRGDCVYYPAGFYHQEHQLSKEAIEVWHLGFKGEVSLPFQRVQDVDGRLRSIIRWIQGERDSSTSSLEVLNGFAQAAVAEIHRILAIKEEVPWVSDVQHYMKAHLHEALTVKDLATVAGHSKYHFIRAYKKAVGKTPMEELRHFRIETAMRLLIETDLPMKTIAPRVGLQNLFHMSRLFKNVLNRPPSYYRKHRLAQDLNKKAIV